MEGTGVFRLSRWHDRENSRPRRGASAAWTDDAPLLRLEHVMASFVRRAQRIVVLDDVTLEVARGEVVAVYGDRMAGRSTLLQVAAGVEHPNSGRVLVEGVDLARDRNGSATAHIGFANRGFATAARSQPAATHVAVALMPRGLSTGARLDRAYAVLDRLGAPAEAEIDELTVGELTLVAVARALVTEPSLLLVDEPTLGVEELDRGKVTHMLRMIAREDDVGVLFTSSTASAAAGVDRALHLSEGRLLGRLLPRTGEVIELKSRSAARGDER